MLGMAQISMSLLSYQTPKAIAYRAFYHAQSRGILTETIEDFQAKDYAHALKNLKKILLYVYDTVKDEKDLSNAQRILMQLILKAMLVELRT